MFTCDVPVCGEGSLTGRTWVRGGGPYRPSTMFKPAFRGSEGKAYSTKRIMVVVHYGEWLEYGEEELQGYDNSPGETWCLVKLGQ